MFLYWEYFSYAYIVTGKSKCFVETKSFNLGTIDCFLGSVPIIPRYANLNKENELARLNRIGKGGGIEEAKKSINLKKINNFSISFCSNRKRVQKNVIILTMVTSKTKINVVLNISGSFTVLLTIFLIIRPLWVVKPVLITTAKVFPVLIYRVLEPS